VTLSERLADGPPLLMDGAMGTELIRRGIELSLPLWSAAALEENPAVVREIHQQYVAAGAELIITDTFRTTPRTFMKVTSDKDEAEERAREATGRAVRLAQEAAGSDIFVAGSIAPLEDCYSPELYPGDETAEREFAQMAGWLSDAGVDLVLLETMGRLDESRAVLRACRRVTQPCWISYILADEKRLLGGESLMDGAALAKRSGASAVLVNCSNLESSVHAVTHLLASTSLPVGLYPNLGKSMPTPEGHMEEVYSVAQFADQMRRALHLGLKIVGSCCGSTPEHTEKLRTVIDVL
jgi:homocysteine S-methyltransferase